MNQLAVQLDEKLQSLGPVRAKVLESLVRAALEQSEHIDEPSNETGWPKGYFEQTAGVLAGQEFHRPPQGKLQQRDEW